MKTFRKKLSLNKKTVANLSSDEMDNINGGYDTYIGPFPSIGCTPPSFISATTCFSLDCRSIVYTQCIGGNA